MKKNERSINLSDFSIAINHETGEIIFTEIEVNIPKSYCTL